MLKHIYRFLKFLEIEYVIRGVDKDLILKFPQDETLHSGADLEALTAAVDRVIGGGGSSSSSYVPSASDAGIAPHLSLLHAFRFNLCHPICVIFIFFFYSWITVLCCRQIHDPFG